MVTLFASRGLLRRCRHPAFRKCGSTRPVASALSGLVDKTVLPAQNGIRNRALPAFRITYFLSFGWPRPNWMSSVFVRCNLDANGSMAFSQRDGVMH
jgi:hypothetical protein